MGKTSEFYVMADSKFEFDDTRNAIGAQNLSDSERKAMLEKFKSGGGQVLSERELREKAEREARSSGSTGGRKVAVGPERKLPSEMARDKARAESDRRAREKEEAEKLRKTMSGPMAKFMIRFRCFLAGVTPFGAPSVRAKFMNFLALDMKQGLVEYNLAGNDLFLQKPKAGRAIIKNLDSRSPLLMETLEYAHHAYKADMFNRLLARSTGEPHADVPLIEIADELKELYKTLYVLYPFQETLKKAYTSAYDIYIAETNASEEEKSSIENRKKKIIKDTKIIFQTGFPKIFQLICRIDGTEYVPFSPYLEKNLGIAQDMKLGKRKRGETGQLNAVDSGTEAAEENKPETENTATETAEGSTKTDEQETKKTEPEKEKKEPPKGLQATKEYKYGMYTMSRISPPDLLKKYDPEGKFSKIPINNKMLLAYLFFMEFDQEYSFVLTTNKIKINPDYSAGVKTDHKASLADLYNSSRDIIKAFEKFTQTVDELDKMKKKKVSSNYVEQSKMESKVEGRISMEARNTRGLLRTFMEQVSVQMAKLLADMKGPKIIIGNMDDQVSFTAVEGAKKLNNKTVKECIMEAYCYSLALKERVESGDLFGGVAEMTDEEMMESFGSTFKPAGSNESEE